MEEKKKWCSRCHGGVLHTTLIPNEMKCNFCGWTKIEIDLKDYWKYDSLFKHSEFGDFINSQLEKNAKKLAAN